MDVLVGVLCHCHHARCKTRTTFAFANNFFVIVISCFDIFSALFFLLYTGLPVILTFLFHTFCFVEFDTFCGGDYILKSRGIMSPQHLRVQIRRDLQ